MPFQFTGMLEQFDMADLMLDKSCISQFATAYGVSLTNSEIVSIFNDTKGYPVALAILMRVLSERKSYNEAVLNEGKRQLYLYFDDMVYRRFDLPLRQLLVKIAPFEPFNIELAALLSEDSRAGELVAQIEQQTSMLKPGAPDALVLRPIFSLVSYVEV